MARRRGRKLRSVVAKPSSVSCEMNVNRLLRYAVLIGLVVYAVKYSLTNIKRIKTIWLSIESGDFQFKQTTGGETETKAKTKTDWWKGKLDVSPEMEALSFYDNETQWIDPNFGAKHPNGSLGMIVDPDPERLESVLPTEESVWKAKLEGTEKRLAAEMAARANLLFGAVDREVICPGGDGNIAGIEGEDGHGVLARIRAGVGSSIDRVLDSRIDKTTEQNETSDSAGHQEKKEKKILCMVYSVHLPSVGHPNLKAQAQTWARRCDGFIAASNITDHSVGAIHLPHLGTEEYKNIWQKVRTLWAYAYHNYLDDYDWFHICGDDNYVAVDNMRAFLNGPKVKKLEKGWIDPIFRVQDRRIKAQTNLMNPRPLMLGIPMPHRGVWFPSGGSGYTLNRAALKLFGEKILTTFLPGAKDSREDVFMGSAFDMEGVFVSDSRDKYNRSRYVGTVRSSILYTGGRDVISSPKQKSLFGIEYGLSADYASGQAVSFHLKDDKNYLHSVNRTVGDLMYRYHTFLYNLTDVLCNSSQPTNE